MEYLHTDLTTTITELKRSPMRVIQEAKDKPIVILNNNKPAGYIISKELFEKIMERLEDTELAKIVKERMNEDFTPIEVNIDEL